MDEYALDIWMSDDKNSISTAIVKGKTRKELSKYLYGKFNSFRFWKKMLEAQDVEMYFRKPGMKPFRARNSKHRKYFIQCCRHYGLSDTEIDVAALLAKAYNDKEIEAALHICYDTVNSHTKNIFKKLNVHSRSEASKQLVWSDIISVYVM